MQNRVFFPQATLDQWIVAGAVDLHAGELTLLDEGRRYRLEEGVHVLREVSGGGDAAQLVGRVKTRAHLEVKGAELVETSMLLGEAAYDVDPGWLGTPVGTFAEHLGSEVRKKLRAAGAAGEAPASEEDLLARFLARTT